MKKMLALLLSMTMMVGCFTSTAVATTDDEDITVVTEMVVEEAETQDEEEAVVDDEDEVIVEADDEAVVEDEEEVVVEDEEEVVVEDEEEVVVEDEEEVVVEDEEEVIVEDEEEIVVEDEEAVVVEDEEEIVVEDTDVAAEMEEIEVIEAPDFDVAGIDADTSITGTAISSAAELAAIAGTSGTYYLANDIRQPLITEVLPVSFCVSMIFSENPQFLSW